MVNELQQYDSLTKEQIMRLTGQEDDSGSGSLVLPKLAINRVGEDDDGNKLEVGTYSIYDTVSEQKVYSKKSNGLVLFRPFIRGYQYMEYDPDTNTYPNYSVIFKSWKDEALDLLGGIKCGKVAFKELDTLTNEEAARQKNIKCYTLVYGSLNMHAVTGKGDSVNIEDLPCLWRITGMNFRPVNESIKSIKNRGKLIQNTNLILSTKRKKHGTNVYYMTNISIDDKQVKFTKKDLSVMELFAETVGEENKRVVESWKDAQKNKPTNDDAVSKEMMKEISPEEALAS
jgi:hypothetical protein